MATNRILLILLALCLLVPACKTPRGASVQEKRNYVREMRDEALQDLYRIEPSARKKIQSAPGYGVFSALSTKILLLSPGQGFGMVVDNATRKETFMRMAEMGAGWGIGIKDSRIIFVFRDRDTMRKFVEHGWQFGGEADVGAKAGDAGASMGAQTKATEGGAAIGGTGQAAVSGTGVGGGAGMEVYQITESGAVVAATVRGTKYWKDGSLN